jgi:hypothetical protein
MQSSINDAFASTRLKFWITMTSCLALCAILLVDGLSVIDSVVAFEPNAPYIAIDRAVVIGSVAVLALLLAWGVRRGGAGSWMAFFIGAVCGIGFFASSVGATIADPSNMTWFLHGADWTTHYAGWAMYRNSPWAWPLGKITTLIYPNGTSVVFTDSLPLLAIGLKPFAAWLPEPFQYTGLWFVACFTLQGAFGALLARRWTRNPAVILAAAALFLYAPIFLNRLQHATLMAHCLVLAALWLYFRPRAERSIAAEIWPWCVVAGFSALIMPYLTAMIMAILAAYLIKRHWVDRDRSLRQLAAMLTAVMAPVLLLWWISGAFMLHYRNGSGGVSHGVYSFNLLGFFNAYGWSKVLPSIPIVSPSQLEGFAYLGLGILALMAVLLFEAAIRLRRPQWPQRHWPLLAMAVALTAFAASTVLTIGPWVLFDHPIKSPLLATFRSSGRFIWVVNYLIVLALVVFSLKRFGSVAAGAVLCVALAVQVWDVGNPHRQTALLRTGVAWPPPMASLNDPGWDEFAANRTHFTMLPPPSCGEIAGPLLPFQLVAARNKMTFNTAYVARWDPAADGRYCAQLTDQLAHGDLHADELYVVSDSWKDRFDQAAKSPTCQMLDGFRACVIDTAAPAPN